MKRRNLGLTALAGLLLLMALITLFPIALMLLNSVKSDVAVQTNPLALPDHFALDNFLKDWDQAHLGSSIFLSARIVFLTVLFTCTTNCLTAYALARRKLRSWRCRLRYDPFRIVPVSDFASPGALKCFVRFLPSRRLWQQSLPIHPGVLRPEYWDPAGQGFMLETVFALTEGCALRPAKKAAPIGPRRMAESRCPSNPRRSSILSTTCMGVLTRMTMPALGIWPSLSKPRTKVQKSMPFTTLPGHPQPLGPTPLGGRREFFTLFRTRHRFNTAA
jgi:hypothetical protein